MAKKEDFGLREKRKEAEILQKIKKVDLEGIKKRMCKPRSVAGLGWTMKKANSIEPQYRAFLYVCWKFKESIQPTVDIDHFWHYHILSTKKYLQDCNKIFGKYIHHNPT